MTQAQPAGYQQLLEENAPDLAAMVGGARASITEGGALPAHVKTLMMMMMSDTTPRKYEIVQLRAARPVATGTPLAAQWRREHN